MNQKMLSLLILASVALSVSSARADGHGPGNGGSVYVCGKKVYLIDLYEPALRKGMKDFIQVRESNDLVETQITNAFRDLGEILPRMDLEARALAEWKEFRKNIEWRSGKYEWKLSDDIGIVPIPDGCEIKNAIMYLSEREIEGQSRYRDAMTPTHQAALEVHEVVYKMMRDRGTVGKDAIPARRLTAMLFSELKKDKALSRSLVARYLARKMNVPTSYLEIPKIENLTVSPVTLRFSRENTNDDPKFGNVRDSFDDLSRAESEASSGNSVLRLDMDLIGRMTYFMTYDFVSKGSTTRLILTETIVDPRTEDKKRKRYLSKTLFTFRDIPLAPGGFPTITRLAGRMIFISAELTKLISGDLR